MSTEASVRHKVVPKHVAEMSNEDNQKTAHTLQIGLKFDHLIRGGQALENGVNLFSGGEHLRPHGTRSHALDITTVENDSSFGTGDQLLSYE